MMSSNVILLRWISWLLSIKNRPLSWTGLMYLLSIANANSTTTTAPTTLTPTKRLVHLLLCGSWDYHKRVHKIEESLCFISNFTHHSDIITPIVPSYNQLNLILCVKPRQRLHLQISIFELSFPILCNSENITTRKVLKLWWKRRHNTPKCE